MPQQTTKRRKKISFQAPGFIGTKTQITPNNSCLFLGVLTPGCTSAELKPIDILGKDKKILKNIYTEYVGEISCYSTDEFNHPIKGQKLFVFCIKNKIVGISIKIKDKSTSDKIAEQIKEKRLVFDNAFGIRKSWKDDSVFKSLCIPKDYHRIDSCMFYSEYLEEASSIIW